MRYMKACQFLKPEMLVIDAACGTGYGTALISRQNQVHGWDNNKAALNEARNNYPLLVFKNVDLLSRVRNDRRTLADAVVSIETIEHFTESDISIYLKNMRNILIGRGTFIVTTPYCIESGPSPITKQHLHEFSLTDLEITLNDAGFSVQAIYPERHEGQAGRLGYCMVHAIAR